MILVTGGGGFLGVNVARRLADRGEQVLLMQRRPLPCPSFLAEHWCRSVHAVQGDVLDLPFLVDLVRQRGVESVIHAAFDTSVLGDPHLLPRAGLPQLVQTQVQGTVNVLEAARQAELRRVTLISSVDVYRGSPTGCDTWTEDAFLPPVAVSAVGNTKRAAEQLCWLYGGTYRFSVLSLRVGRVYGPAGAHGDPIMTMVEQAVAGVPTSLAFSAGARTHPIYAVDAAEAIARLHLTRNLDQAIFNVADGTNPTYEEIAAVVRRAVPGARIKLGPSAEVVPRPVDVSRLVAAAGMQPRGLEEGVASYVAWLREGEWR